MIKLHREGRWIVLITIMILMTMIILSTLFLPWQVNYIASALSIVVLILVLRFFRIPNRRPFLAEKTITAPADGKVVVIEHMVQEEFL